jgi:hypothetical protein
VLSSYLKFQMMYEVHKSIDLSIIHLHRNPSHFPILFEGMVILSSNFCQEAGHPA